MSRWGFHTCVHTYNLVLVQNWSLTLNVNGNPDCSFHLIVWFFLPILSLVLLVQHTYWVCQMTGDCSAYGGAEHSVAGGAECFVTQDVDCSEAGALNMMWLGVLSILGMHSWLVLPITIPVFFMLFLILTNGAMQSPGAFLHSLLRHHHGMGDCCNLGDSSVLMVGADVVTGVGGIGQSFLVTNKFSEADPVLARGALSGWGIGYIIQWWRVGFFILGSGCGTWDLSKLSLC